MEPDRDEMLALGEYIREEFPDDAPREPGRYKVTTNGAPTWTEGEVECDFCGHRIHHSGINFGTMPECSMHPDTPDCWVIHVHWGESCPALRWRLNRLKTALTWPVERRWKSWRWKRRSKQERSDPEAWGHFWADQEEDDE